MKKLPHVWGSFFHAVGNFIFLQPYEMLRYGNEFTPKVSHAHNSDDKMKNEGMDI